MAFVARELRRIDSTAQKEPPLARGNAASRPAIATLLLVSADDALTATMRELLATEGYRLLVRTSGHMALDLTLQLRLDAIVIDADVSDIAVEELCRNLRRQLDVALTPILVVGRETSPAVLESCIEAGAEDGLTRSELAAVLPRRLRALIRLRQRFEVALASQAAHQSLSALLRMRIDALAEQTSLSSREREVLDLVLLGRNTSEMGVAMSISERTAKFHVANVLRKLGLESRLELFRLLL